MTVVPDREGEDSTAGAAIDDDVLLRMPKAELHVHLDGSVRPETLLDLGARYGVAMPAHSPVALRDYMHVRDARDLVDYLKRFEITLSVMQTSEALERIAYELALDLAAENVRYAEIRYCPALNTREGLALEETVEAPLRGLEAARKEVGIYAAIIVCAIRSHPASESTTLAELAGRYRGRGVVGFDLAGPEAGFPPAAHAEAFAIARHHGLRVTVHAGEAAGPASIREAIEVCGADRIGHGTRLFEDEELLQQVRNARIPIEVCLTSNVQTRAVSTFETHPLRRYFDEGLVVTINTDNRLMSGTTMTQEYRRAQRHLGFTPGELGEISRMAFVSAFTPRDAMAELTRRAIEEIAAVTRTG